MKKSLLLLMLLVPCRSFSVVDTVSLGVILGLAGGIPLLGCFLLCECCRCCPQVNENTPLMQRQYPATQTRQIEARVSQATQIREDRLATQARHQREAQPHCEQCHIISAQPTDRALMSPEPSKNQLFLDSRR